MEGSTHQFWEIQHFYIKEIFSPILLGFLILLPFLVAFFLFFFWKLHYRLWHCGKNERRRVGIGFRLKTLLMSTLTHSRFWKKPYPALMHILIFWGIGFIFLGKLIRLFSLPFGLTTPPQSIFLYSSFVSEMGGGLILIGGSLAVIRRYLFIPYRLETQPDRTLIFIWGFGILITGFLIKSYRLAAARPLPPPDWFFWTPISYPISHLLPVFPTELLNELFIWHRIFIHALPTLALFFYITLSHSSLQHLYLSPLNIFLRPLTPKGALSSIPDFEEAETYGAKDLFEFSWKQLLDLEACTHCGRCEEQCPAHLSEKPLSPKKVIQDLKTLLYEKGKALLWNSSFPSKEGLSLLELLSEDTIWACTFCLSCYEHCPVFISVYDKILELRRYMVLMESRYPIEIREVFKNLERRSNPWGAERHLRTDWASLLEVKSLHEDPEVEILYFAGCFNSYDDRSKKVAISLSRILKHAGVKFGILGKEEGCCGDSVRRIGNEYLFKNMAEANIQTMRQYGVKRILTSCPHCFNTLKNEYPQFGGNFEVIHHTEYLLQLLQKQRLSLKRRSPITVTYHDSCYLGRYNGIYEEPRKILTSISGVRLKEMERSRVKSFCCGGGGGRMWMEEHLGKRINELRIDQALALDTQQIVTACPYCLTMFEDGLKAKGKEDSVKVLDIAELLEKAMEGLSQ